MRFFEIYVFIVIINLLFGVFNGLSIYVDASGVGHTLGPNVKQNPDLTPNNGLTNIGCSIYTNGSTSCSPPSALQSPGLSSSAFIFGFFMPVITFLFSFIGAGGFIANLLINDVGVYYPFALVIGGAIDLIFVLAFLAAISGRYIES